MRVWEKGLTCPHLTARRISLGDVELQVIPPPGIPGWEQNNNSVGLIVEYGNFRLSLAGDAEQRQWTWWVENYPNQLQAVDAHKASHHGSSNGDGVTGSQPKELPNWTDTKDCLDAIAETTKKYLFLLRAEDYEKVGYDPASGWKAVFESACVKGNE